jgi:hypothetical protein
MTLPLSHRAGPYRISRGRVRSVHVGLLAYGLVIALFGMSYFSQHLPTQAMTIESGRQQMIENSIAVLNAGGPPLLASRVPYRQGLKNPQTSFFEADQTDDPGVYLYLPIVGHLTGDANALSLLKWFFIGSMALLLLSYPIVFYLLFDSIVVGALAPLIVLFEFGFLRNTEIYWVPAWTVMLCMPAVFLVARARWRRGLSLTALFLVAVVGSYATSIRAEAGLPVALAAIAVAALRERRIAWRVGAAAIVAVGYLSIDTVGLHAVRAYRNHVSHMQVASASNGHPFWHPAYLGLGYLPNKWGIRWNDSVAFSTAQSVDPKVVYLSPHYNSILRHLYFKIVKSDPGYVLDLYTTKVAVNVNHAVGRFWLALLFLPAALLVGSRRREMRLYVALLLPALVIALAPPVMTLPYVYDVGWIGTVGFLALLVLAWGFVTARDAIDHIHVDWHEALEETPAGETVRSADAWARGRIALLRPLRRTLLAAGVGMLLFVGVGVAASAKQASKATAIFYQSDAGYLAAPLPPKLLVQRWSFAKGVPAGWQPAAGTAVSSIAGATRIVTTTPPAEYELVSPTINAKPGTYVVQIDGRPVTGGVGVGVASAATNGWLNTGYYFADMPGYSRERMNVPFTLAQGDTFKVILLNWARVPSTSTWDIKNIELIRKIAKPANG